MRRLLDWYRMDPLGARIDLALIAVLTVFLGFLLWAILSRG